MLDILFCKVGFDKRELKVDLYFVNETLLQRNMFQLYSRSKAIYKRYLAITEKPVLNKL